MDNSKLKISIVTVCLNAERTIERAIQSVVGQSFPKIEYIIIDGVSSDGTLDIIRKYSEKISKWISEPDKGIYDAMNKGVSLATGNYVYFLGADDMLIPEAFEFMRDLQIKDDRVIYGNVLMTPKNVCYDGYFTKYKLSIKNICHQAILYPINKAKNNPYDLRYKVCADYVLNIKLWGLFGKFQYYPNFIAVFNTTGISKNQDPFFRMTKYSLMKEYFGTFFLFKRRIINLYKFINNKIISCCNG